MEQLVKDRCELEHEADKDLLADLDRKPLPDRPQKPTEPPASMQRPNYFDCDVSEIPANRYSSLTSHNKTGISEDSKLGSLLNHQFAPKHQYSELTRPLKQTANHNLKLAQEGRFKDKLKKKLQDAKKIDEDPSAFIEPDSQDLGSQQPAPQASSQPQTGYYSGPNMYAQYLVYPNGQMVSTAGMPLMLPQMAYPPASYYPVTSDPKQIIEHQKQILLAELREIESQKQKVRAVEAENQVNTRFKKTEDILNKYNEDYELEESQLAFTRPTKSKQEIMDSIQKLDSLLLKKKANQPIPFIDTYTPARKKPSARDTHAPDCEQDSLEAVEEKDPVSHLTAQQGYMSKKIRMVEHRAAAEPRRREERQPRDSKVVVENEHGVVKVSNKANLHSLFD